MPSHSGCGLLAELLVPRDAVKQLAATAVIHDDVEMTHVLVHLVIRDDVWVIGNQLYLIVGDKNEKKLEIIILQLK